MQAFAVTGFKKHVLMVNAVKIARRDPFSRIRLVSENSLPKSGALDQRRIRNVRGQNSHRNKEQRESSQKVQPEPECSCRIPAELSYFRNHPILLYAVFERRVIRRSDTNSSCKICSTVRLSDVATRTVSFCSVHQR